MAVPKVQVEGRRANVEWIASHPDQAIPEHVKARIFARYGGKCPETGVKLQAGDYDFDHIKSLRNGGEHRETNLRPIWRPAHREKTAEENAAGAKADRANRKHLGLWKPKSGRRIARSANPWGYRP